MDTATDLPPPREPLDHERVIRYLLERMVNRKLPRGCIFEAAIHFGCTQQTVSAIFRARDKDTPESARGFARVWTPEAIQEAVEASVMEQAMLNKGGNEYKIPHIGKNKLLRSGELPDTLACSVKAVNVAKSAFEEVVV
ncbi:hypothetical protein PI125_g21608 [Phytophthora idaei]|nr:hypothetical protein PI125_g21608 [Phytophthora idaei]KAG3132888.1 hypothetical protein PI126_g19429 [Phytophthora idaei]